MEDSNSSKHAPPNETKKELENMLSKINALEAATTDSYQLHIIKTLEKLAHGQIHAVNEFEHLKKAIDQVTLQLFDLQNKINSK